MNKITLLPLLSLLFVSCDPEMHRFPHERTRVKKPVIKKVKRSIPLVAKPKHIPAPASVRKTPTDLSSAFLTPTQDTNLPSSEQLADGAQSAIGSKIPDPEIPSLQIPTIDPNSPIVPSIDTPAPEDDLFPTE